MATRGDTTCQHALFMLRWLGRAPETFVPGPAACATRAALPVAGSAPTMGSCAAPRSA
jgi:hypothetical protein